MSALSFNQALEAHARKLVTERINELGRQIGAGHMPSFEQYKYHCGIIKGLQEGLDLLETALKEIQTAGRGDISSG